ncbi:MAG TPA: diguanylate cyclase [Solirubrobacteraceae bacterium]|nr:diguanylate cyclase [Solirubrobacteraceae bacterium]
MQFATAQDVAAALDRARALLREAPSASLDEAQRSLELARELEDDALCSRALTLQGEVAVHRGELHTAFNIAAEAERHAIESDDPAAQVELEALLAHLCFFSGSYAHALAHADRALAVADLTGDNQLRTFARRQAYLVFGNIGVRSWHERLEELLDLTQLTGSLWEEAISRNDIACELLENGDIAGAQAEIERARETAERIEGANTFALAVIHCTRADIQLAAADPLAALADAQRTRELLDSMTDGNPYVLGATIRAEVQAHAELGNLDAAERIGRQGLEELGERMPRSRSEILLTLSKALRDGGRIEAAYEALELSAQLERIAFREIAELQTHANKLETQQQQLRDQAHRDWLTGLHNRRYLAQAFAQLADRRATLPLSIAILDLDFFKNVNDQMGHSVGDQVLVRVAALLALATREQDIVARSGGEEFTIVMPQTDARAAVICCERMRTAIADSPDWDDIAPGLAISASVGVATAFEPIGLDALAHRADERLYEAKRAGRNRVVA